MTQLVTKNMREVKAISKFKYKVCLSSIKQKLGIILGCIRNKARMVVEVLNESLPLYLPMGRTLLEHHCSF